MSILILSESPISSTAADLLLAELRRYRDDQPGRRGRSLLVAGHRGAGKTYLVERTLASTENDPPPPGQAPRRLLRVDIHGPTLLGGAAGDRADEGAAPRAEGEAGPGDDPMVKAALEQIVLSLYRALVGEVTRRYRERVEERIAAGEGVRAAELLERAAQLELELDEYPGADRLRDYWRAGGFLDGGVLFPDPVQTSLPRDQGLRELVAISTACEVFRRISGIFPTIKETQNLGASQNESASTGLDTTRRDLLTPAVSLLTGGLVGGGLFAGTGGAAVASTLGGLIAALGASLVFTYSGGRSRQRSVSREYTFVPDRSVATLDRALPALIRRVESAGLVPVFVVDELDKVMCLPTRMRDIVRHLKKFVSEQAFFCFLTDRSYFEYLTQRTAAQAYPIEHTYFTNRLFVVFPPESLYTYVGARLKLSEPPEPAEGQPPPAPTPEEEEARRITAADLAALPYVILQRAEMHPIDLVREFGDIRGPAGEMAIPPGALRSETRNRCDLMIQLAVRMLLGRPDLRTLMEREPEVTRLAYDSVYYPVRARRLGQFHLDLTEEGRTDFVRYLERRMVPDRLDQRDYQAVSLGTTDVSSFYGLVRDLAELLSDPFAYQDALANWEAETGIPLDPDVRQALPFTLPTGPLLSRAARFRYDWGYDHLGRSVDESPRSALAYQLDLEYRLGIHMVLNDLRADPDRRRILQDILWLPHERWRAGARAVPSAPELAALVGQHLTPRHAHPDHVRLGQVKLDELCTLLAKPGAYTSGLPAEWVSAYPLVLPLRDHSPLLA
jgi:hypothetical protein